MTSCASRVNTSSRAWSVHDMNNSTGEQSDVLRDSCVPYIVWTIRMNSSYVCFTYYNIPWALSMTYHASYERYIRTFYVLWYTMGIPYDVWCDLYVPFIIWTVHIYYSRVLAYHGHRGRRIVWFVRTVYRDSCVSYIIWAFHTYASRIMAYHNGIE